MSGQEHPGVVRVWAYPAAMLGETAEATCSVNLFFTTAISAGVGFGAAVQTAAPQQAAKNKSCVWREEDILLQLLKKMNAGSLQRFLHFLIFYQITSTAVLGLLGSSATLNLQYAVAGTLNLSVRYNDPGFYFIKSRMFKTYI